MSQPSPSPTTYAVSLPRPRPLLSPNLEKLLHATRAWLMDAEADGWGSVEGDEREGVANCARWLAAHATGREITPAMRQEVEDLERLLVEALSHRQRLRYRRLAMLGPGREA